MGILVILCLVPWLIFTTSMDPVNDTELLVNSSDPNKDMYVIHAMVYQVGIITNKTDNETANFNETGHQEAVTFFHNNGTEMDFSQIPAPLLTNVTAQSLVGVAPVSSSQDSSSNQLPWSTLNQLTNIASPQNPNQESLVSPASMKTVRDTHANADNNQGPVDDLYANLFKREASDGDTALAIRKGAAVVPQAAGVQSIAIPPLLTLNNNFSEIPVPIPNTSVVHYAKINTLVTKP